VTATHEAPVEPLLRQLAPQVLGAVVRRFRDFTAAEDAVQEALLAASLQWPRDGLPENPRGWLIHVAARRLTDHARSEMSRRRREADAVASREESVEQPMTPRIQFGAGIGVLGALDRDDTLTLLFMCCHPSLPAAPAIALTLRAVGGLTTAEIAKAFLVPEPTMAQRISRAKQRIKGSGVPFGLPTQSERPERLRAVLHVLYLMFNEGYTTSAGPALHRVELTSEAIRLTRLLHRLLPAEPEVAGLLALMLLTDARRHARTGADGSLIPLADQDRQLWDRDLITEGIALISATLPKGAVGPYQLQAAIAAVHDEAACVDATDWAQILALYAVLTRIDDNPMVALNHAIATAMVRGPRAGLTLVDGIAVDARIASHHRVAAARAHLLELAGDDDAAIHYYRLAADRTSSLPERNYLLTRAARLAERRMTAR
jgi:RNA polymerase sigma factor (sigma-70 family)